MGIAEEASLMDEKSSKRCNNESAPQHIPNIALTATTIKVTRFRTFTTPYINRNTILRYLPAFWQEEGRIYRNAIYRGYYTVARR